MRSLHITYLVTRRRRSATRPKRPSTRSSFELEQKQMDATHVERKAWLIRFSLYNFALYSLTHSLIYYYKEPLTGRELWRVYSRLVCFLSKLITLWERWNTHNKIIRVLFNAINWTRYEWLAGCWVHKGKNLIVAVVWPHGGCVCLP